MSVAELLLAEFDQEVQNNKKTLERVPAEKWDWKPHEKSGSLGWLAGHLATLPGFLIPVIQESQMEIANFPSPKVQGPGELLTAFESTRTVARAALASLKDSSLNDTWTLLWEGKTIFALPRYAVLRGPCFNHFIHHRGQLTMYLRTLNVPLPALYGPSADEQS